MTTSWTATQWIPWMTLISTWIDGTTADPSQTICPAPSWQVAEAEFIQWPQCPETRWEADPATSLSAAQQQPLLKAPEETLSVVSVSMAASSESSARPDHELDTESPLDNANFLSFEDWKKQNLAKVGQSAENVGARGAAAAAAGKEGRRRPTGINNALDSLGEDVEIELDFGGFGADTPEAAKPTSWGARVSTGGTTEEGGPVGDVESLAQGVPPAGGVSRSKDAGTTCKERFNYASFDCAATVLKTNPECTGSSSVLIENKDSYMLNECRANNKFLILELCDDILVDTVVLANYEFFSSIFHTFRVSVSDRYPAKLDQWRELGIYEARNTREVQAFAVENPLIWARYVKIEFLTHYGNEFFCPLSLIRVHGTTMLEEYKHDGEVSRTDDVVADEEPEPAPVAAEIETIPTVDVAPAAGTAEQKVDEQTPETCPNPGPVVDETVMMQLLGVLETCSIHDSPAAGAEGTQTSLNRPPATDAAPPKGDDTASVGNEAPAKEAGEQKATVSPNVDSAPSSDTTAAPESTSQGEADSRSTGFTKEEQSVAAETTRSTATQPPSANPTTQESFFKSVNKRLQMLESNSSLSLLYIEEQSRILRDAFNKVEKRQLAKTSTFLEQLNVTVLHELKQFREQYDNVWKSVALEFEHQRIQYHQEVHSLSAQLGVLADELVFQKRVAVIQSIMILFCFGLVLFSRGAVSSYIELPSMQNMVSRSYSLRSSSPPFGSPSVSPTSSGRRAGGHRRNLSEDSQEDGPISPTLAYSPPTPVSDVMSSSEEAENHRGNSLALPEVAPPVRSRSSPPDLKGGEESIEESSSSGESPVSHERNAAVAEA